MRGQVIAAANDRIIAVQRMEMKNTFSGSENVKIY